MTPTLVLAPTITPILGRVPMNSADFSRMDYTMVDDLDVALDSFCLRDDSATEAP